LPQFPRVTGARRLASFLLWSPGMRKLLAFGLLLCAAPIASADPAASLDAPTRAAKQGGDATGSVEGTIRYVGAKKPSAPAAVPKTMTVCGKTKPPQDLMLGSDHGLANAVVSVVGVAGAPKPSPVKASIDQNTCAYVPHVQAVPVGSKLVLLNSDATLHNVHARRGDLTLVNVAMPVPGLHIDAPGTLLSKTGVVSFKCDAGHTWMSAYVHVFDHPYFAVTDANGRFKIDGLPPGTYTLKVDHELLGSSTKSITVSAGAAASGDVEIK
jgi:hypothetical protein